jgi:hypothetical protein
VSGAEVRNLKYPSANRLNPVTKVVRLKYQLKPNNRSIFNTNFALFYLMRVELGRKR